MIGQLRGTIVQTTVDTVLVDVQGVGYEVFCPARLLGQLSVSPDRAVTLVIETVVREDLIRLYGFADPAEREWFRLLQSVQGVGARVALALLSVLSPEDLALALAQADHSIFARAQGVGPKLAKRLVTELKDRAPSPVLSAAPTGGAVAAAPKSAGPQGDAVSALVNLGYGQADAARAVATAERALEKDGAAVSVEALIRAGLRELM